MKPIWVVVIFLFVYGVFSIKVDAAPLSDVPAVPALNGGQGQAR